MDHNKLFKFLAQIANDIILNIDFHDKKGISDGRMGSVLFLYIYAELKDSEILFSLCNEQLLIILDALNENDMSYSYGVAGIADVLLYLHNEDLIEIPDREDFFANVNIEIMRGYMQPSLEPESLYTTLYLLDDFDASGLENVDQIEKLLYLERAVDHVDEIEAFLGSLEVLRYNKFTESMDRTAGIVRLTNISKNLLNAAEFLHVLKEKGIYLNVVERCLSILQEKNSDLLELVREDTESVHPFLASSTSLHFLTVSFYISFYFKGTIDEGSGNEFQTLVTDFLGTKALGSGLNLRENSVSLHIGTLIRLSQINSKLCSELIQTGIDNYLDAVIRNFDENDFCLDFTSNSSIEATMGLLGPAGLGVLMIVNHDKKFISVNRILKNLYTI